MGFDKKNRDATVDDLSKAGRDGKFTKCRSKVKCCGNEITRAKGIRRSRDVDPTYLFNMCF